jgi:hypothetical protein
MSIIDLFRPAMKRHEYNGRWCEVGELRSVFFDGQPCYEIDGRGDMQFYLGDCIDPLYIEETPQGWTVGYRPNDDDFARYANRMMELGAWK